MIECGKNEALIEKVVSKRKMGMTKYQAELITVTVEGNLKTGSSKCDLIYPILKKKSRKCTIIHFSDNNYFS